MLIAQQMCRSLTENMPDGFIRSVQRLFIAGEIVEHAFCHDEDMFGEVERGGDYEEREDEEEYGVCRIR